MSSKRQDTVPNSNDWDKQYHKTVLKVPDSLGIAQGAITREMLMTQRELFQVT